MKRLAYETDAYLTELATEVVDSGRDDDRPFVVTADTIFYPEGGGQPADAGTIGGIEVVDVQKVNDVVRHFVNDELPAGPARQGLDWGRRFDHMQQHTGQHLLTSIAQQHFGWPTLAFHLGPVVSDLELDAPRLGSDELRRLEDAVVEEIRAARPVGCRYARMEQMEELGVRSRLLPDGHSGEIRLVEIEGIDLNTCGGTHVRNTSEIGTLVLVGTEPMRGGTRVFFVAGDRVRRRLAEHERRNLRLRTLLDAADDDLPDVVELRLQREKELARERRRLTVELARLTADRLLASPEPVISGHWEDRDLPFLQEIGKALVERSMDCVALLTAGRDPGGSFVLVAGEGSGLELGVVGPELSATLEGRGGGRVPFFQGKAAALDRRDEALEALRRLLGDEGVRQ